MKKSTIGIIVVVVAVVGVLAIAMMNNKNKTNTASSTSTTTNTASNTQADQPAANTVEMKGFAFGPTKLTVKVGTTVTWKQMDDTKHDVQPDSPTDAFKGSALLAQGQTYSFTFNKAGTYTYHCNPHPYMKGTIEVTE